MTKREKERPLGATNPSLSEEEVDDLKVTLEKSVRLWNKLMAKFIENIGTGAITASEVYGFSRIFRLEKEEVRKIVNVLVKKGILKPGRKANQRVYTFEDTKKKEAKHEKERQR